MSTSIRVVFLANDAVLPQGLAFLESFRTSNPNTKLSMIPFANDIEQIAKLQHIYKFDILSLNVDRWDDLAKDFFPGAVTKYLHRLRKLAIFDAWADVTIYLDLDMVVLENLDFLAAPIIAGDVDFICTASANDPWVYKNAYKSHPQLTRALRFSDGFFAFSPKKITADSAYRIITENRDLYLSVRADLVYCQPITNFIVDMFGLKVSEVFKMFPNVSPQVWYASEELTLVDDHVVSCDGRDVLFVHWAGPVDMASEFRLRSLFETYLDRGRVRAVAAGVQGL